MLSYIYNKLRGNKSKKVLPPMSAEQALEHRVKLNRIREDLIVSGFLGVNGENDYNNVTEERSSISSTHSANRLGS